MGILTSDDISTQGRRFVLDPQGVVARSVVRVSDAGAATVRLPAGVLPSNGLNVFWDYEAPMTGDLRYVVYGGASGTTVIASMTIPYDQLDPSGNYLYPPGNWVYDQNVIIAAPLAPSVYLDLWLSPRWESSPGITNPGMAVTIYGEARQTQATVHEIVRRTDPIVVLLGSARPAGTFTVQCPSLAAARSLERLLAQPYVWQLRQSAQRSIDMYFAALGTRLAHGDMNVAGTDPPQRRWQLDVDFAEVAIPSGVIVPNANWLYGTLPGAASSYLALLALYPTYAALLAGPA